MFPLFRILLYLCPVMKKILFFTMLLLLSITASAQLGNIQNQYSQLGSSASGVDRNKYDRNGNPIDSTAVNDASTVPISLHSWTIDERLGTIFNVPVDTLQYMFQNSNDTGGETGHYNYLGNLGSPRLSRIFFEREDNNQFIFTDPYDFTVRKPKDIIYTNTKSPFTNLTYYKQGDGRYGEERFKSYFAVNANKRLGVGFFIDYTYGRGKYSNQSTALFNGGLFASYRGNHYDMHMNFVNENLKVAENGGITDDRYITNPIDMAEGKKQYSTSEIPTNLSEIWNKNTGYHGFLTHRYNLGFYRDNTNSNDTTDTKEFVPVTSFVHTLKLDFSKRKYISYDAEQNQAYFNNNYLLNDSTDRTDYVSVKNTLGISLREGFNKWAKAGLTAFVSHEYRKFTLTDTTATPNERIYTPYVENTISVGGQLLKEQGKMLHYNVIGEIAVLGEDAGQFTLEGNGDLNFRLFNDTVRFTANAYIKNLNPTFYYRHFHSKHYWWDNEDLSKIMRTRIEGKLAIDRWKTELRVGVENIKNYTYFDNTSVKYTNEQDAISYKNDLKVSQFGGNIQVLSAMLRQDFKLGILHLDNEVIYQKSSNEDILPLPELSLYHNLYLRFGLAKRVLSIDMGADVRYFTSYYAPDYSPAMGQFYLQNKETRVKIGNYPLVNAYINMHLKRTRIFLQMYNLVQGSTGNSYFLAPHYPLNPRILKVGISWNFFD